MLEFQRYQQAFTAHLRNPKTNPKPKGVNAKRVQVYRHGVFNNIFESVTVCFPVSQLVLGKRKWLKLCQQFFSLHASGTPLFREIPESFLAFINQQDLRALALPSFLPQLAHYEWAELGVSHMKDTTHSLNKPADLINEHPILIDAHLLLAYDYPVHKISKRIQPSHQSATYLLIFRDKAFKIRFIELNAITFQLLTAIKQYQFTGKQALMHIAQCLQHSQPEMIVQFGADILQDLMEQGAIIGSVKR